MLTFMAVPLLIVFAVLVLGLLIVAIQKRAHRSDPVPLPSRRDPLTPGRKRT